MLLDEETLKEGTHFLIKNDPAMDFVFQKYSYPPLWSREPGFATLTHIILEQQVSLASANATFFKLKEKLKNEVNPEAFLTLNDEQLRELGYSYQKTNYTRFLANALISGTFSFTKLIELDDEAVKIEMKKLKGIGDWSAEVYLSECLMRTDIIPKGDIAVMEALKVLKKLEKRPQHDQVLALTESWRPWRSVGTRLLWHFYLGERNRKNTI
jgi:DNA-3-methyladenine glycosylase II